MKKIILITLAMFCTVFAGCRPNSGQKFYNATPTSFFYQYSGMTAYPIFSYGVETREDGTVALSFSEYGPEVTVYKAPDDLFQRIGDIARKYKLYKLQRSYHPDIEILDGYGWSMQIYYPDGYILSGGSNAEPGKKLSEGISAILKMLHDIVENAGPEDIIGHDSLRR